MIWGGAILRIIGVALLLSLAEAPVFGADEPTGASLLVARMGDSSLTQEERDAAAGALFKMGKMAMPTLIDSLHDNRVFHPNYESQNGTNGASVTVNLTVGVECNNILMEIVSNGASGKGLGFKYKVLNWPVWWKKHKDMPQPEMQKEVWRLNEMIIESTGKGDNIPRINQP